MRNQHCLNCQSLIDKKKIISLKTDNVYCQTTQDRAIVFYFDIILGNAIFVLFISLSNEPFIDKCRDKFKRNH